MSDLNEKKAELHELDNDLRRLTLAVQQFDELESLRKIVFLGLGSLLTVCGIAALAGSFLLARTSSISLIYPGLSLLIAVICLFFGIRLLSFFLKLWQTLRQTARIIAEVEARKIELEREIALDVK